MEGEAGVESDGAEPELGMSTSSAQTVVREAIEGLLLQFLANPFHNVREHDYQAVLFGDLRVRIPNSVPVRFAMKPEGSDPHGWVQPRTARVHRESCIGPKGIVGGYVNVDLVVLRDAEVELPCHIDGPTGLQETVLLDDVEVAVEIKNAPSKNKGQALKFVSDVTRLAKLQKQRGELICFSLVIDQSISLPLATSKYADVRDWLAMVPDLHRYDVEPPRPFVEVWFVDPKSLLPQRVFFAVT